MLLGAGKLMKNLMEQAAAFGVKDNVLWLDKFVPTDELMMVFKCTFIYLTTFDESTPTSVTPFYRSVISPCIKHGSSRTKFAF